ncbi:MAG: hypothetical protein ABEJ56_00280 [Candidatus Nanohaloarchaea archaeon]
MPSEEEISRIRKYASEGYSVNYIMKILDIPKSTVYYHLKKEVGQKQKENSIEIPEESEIIGEICGVFAGDGNYYYDEKKCEYRIKIILN